MIRELFEILVPTFLAALSGWVWVRSGRQFDRKMIGDLIMMIGAPCLIFSSLVSLEVSASAMLEMARRRRCCPFWLSESPRSCFYER